jgi:transmembrane sensor
MTGSGRTEEEAADWLARLDRGLDQEEEIAFQRWKADAIENRVVFLQLQNAWQRADRLGALRSPQGLPRPISVRWRLSAAIAAVLTLCAALGAYRYLAVAHPDPQQFETAVGKQRSLQLADGTHVELNTDTIIHATMGADSRTVRLDRGQAYFEVVHDARHPFVVIAGNRRITDIGTKFSVLRDGDRVEVVVKEGQVQVDVIGQDTAGAAPAPVLAERNTVVIARNAETLVAVKTPREIDNAMLWRTGMLYFNQESLADVAADINRYNTRRIEVVGPARDIRIGGSFRRDNIDGFKQLLRDGFGLKIVDAGDKIVISN